MILANAFLLRTVYRNYYPSKINYRVSLIHSVDSLKLLKEIQKQSLKQNVVTKILLQIHVAQEDSKYGFVPNELVDLFATHSFTPFTHVQICGVMSMATLTQNTNQIEEEFQKTVDTFHGIKKLITNSEDFTEISMGFTQHMTPKRVKSSKIRGYLGLF